MEKLLDFSDIALMPGIVNSGVIEDKYDFGVLDSDGTASLPIFTAPSDSVVGMANFRVYEEVGIKPVLPRSVPLEQRLDMCQRVFVAFTMKEVEENFIGRGKRNSQYQFHICIDNGNGHDTKLIQLGSKLKQLYQDQANVMAGNIGNAKVYLDYCKAGIDYIRVGMSSGSLVVPDKYGFYTPPASMLLDILGMKSTVCVGLKHTKVILDGGLSSPSDMLKALALGADYVMLGRVFAKLLDGCGTIYRKIKTPEGNDTLEAVSKDIIKTGAGFKELGLRRQYTSTQDDARYKDAKRSEWVEINDTLESWLRKVYDVFSYGFLMSGAKNWGEFRNNIKFGRLN